MSSLSLSLLSRYPVRDAIEATEEDSDSRSAMFQLLLIPGLVQQLSRLKEKEERRLALYLYLLYLRCLCLRLCLCLGLCLRLCLCLCLMSMATAMSLFRTPML